MTPKQPDDDAQDPLSEMFARLFGGQAGDMDPAAMAKAAGLPSDPERAGPDVPAGPSHDERAVGRAGQLETGP